MHRETPVLSIRALFPRGFYFVRPGFLFCVGQEGGRKTVQHKLLDFFFGEVELGVEIPVFVEQADFEEQGVVGVDCDHEALVVECANRVFFK